MFSPPVCWETPESFFLSLHPLVILFPFLVMLSVYSSNIDLYPALHNFPIDMRELCERPGSKGASLLLAGNLGNVSVHAFFNDILLPHADETMCDLVCVNFNGVCLAWCMCKILLYPQVHILLYYLLCGGGQQC